MHKHHIIPKHEWKRRFGNLKGFNDFDNVVYLTVEQHAEVHKLLYELNGSEFDRIAYDMLSGSSSQKEKARKEAVLIANKENQYAKGNKHIRSEEYKRNMSDRMKGHPKLLGNRNACGKHKTKILTHEHKEKIRSSMLNHHKIKLEEIRDTIEQHGS